jgi:hypothetical protein
MTYLATNNSLEFGEIYQKIKIVMGIGNKQILEIRVAMAI